MLSFTKIDGLFSRTPRHNSSRRLGQTLLAIEPLEGRLLLCAGGCHWHLAQLDQISTPTLTGTSFEISRVVHANQHSPVDYGTGSTTAVMANTGCGCHAPADPGPMQVAADPSSALPSGVDHGLDHHVHA